MRILDEVLLVGIALLLPLSGCNQLNQPAEASITPFEMTYDQAVPEGQVVDDNWFAGTAMIGHSMMRGMELYSGLDTPDYYTLSGSCVAELLTSNEVTLPDGGMGSLGIELPRKNYDRLYLFMGINEIVGDLGELQKDYVNLIELVREASPEASVYILAVLPVTEEKAAEGIFTLEGIQSYNEMLKDICKEQQCWYLDVFDCFADESGYLPASSSDDGVHLKQEEYQTLSDYLKTHTID